MSDQNEEYAYRQTLRKHGFSLKRRQDGIYEIYKGQYIRMVGDLEKEVAEFVASLEAALDAKVLK